MLEIIKTLRNTCSSGESSAFDPNFRIKRKDIIYCLYSNPKVFFFLSYFMLCNEKKEDIPFEKKMVFILWFLAFVFLYLCMTNRY